MPPPLGENDPYCMSLEERQEWRRKIREVIDMKPDIQEELDHGEKKKKLKKLMIDYRLLWRRMILTCQKMQRGGDSACWGLKI